MKRILILLTILHSSFGILHSQVPNLISYQGRVAVGTPPANFNGTGQFKFALYRPGTITTVWSNDSTSVAGSEPTTAVSLTVTKGLYSVLLGDSTIPNMQPIPASVWAFGDLHLRVWFNDGTNGFQLLTPDQRLAPNGYLPDGSVSSAALGAGAVTNAKIASQAVDSAQLAPNAVTTAKIANNAVTSTQLATGAVTGAKLASNVGLWSVTGGDVYRGSGNVGIGTATPTSKLTVLTATDSYGLTHTDGTVLLNTYVDADGGWIGTSSDHPLHFYANNGYEQMTLLQNGNVGIGTSAPDQQLTVAGSALLGSSDNTALAVDAGGYARLGFIKKSGSNPVIASALNAPIIFSQTDQASVFTNIGTSVLTERMRIASDGNVGIGTSAPFASVTHVNSQLPGNAIYDSTTHGLHVAGGDNGLVVIEGSNRAGLHFRSSSGGDLARDFAIRHDPDGYLTFAAPYGFGSSDFNIMKMKPYEVSIFDDSYSGGALWVRGAGSVHVGGSLFVDEYEQHPSQGLRGVKFGGSSSLEFIASNRTGGAGAPNWQGLEFYTQNISRLTITNGGSVGIGTSNPSQAKLVVNGINGSVNIGAFAYFNPATGTSVVQNPNNANSNRGDLSLYCTGAVAAQGVYSFSDARIKSITGLSDGAADLGVLRGIEVTDYFFKDTVARGGNPQKKVIAQQVEKVFPMAVSRRTDVVPDIFKGAEIEDGWVMLQADLKKGERVRIMGEKDEGIHEVLEVKKDRFRTAFKPEGKQVFVYGREVNDFRSVDYDAISMLNVSATQELARRHEAEVKAKDAEIAALKKQLADQAAAMKTLAAKQAARDDALEARLARLEQAAPSNAVKVAMRK